MRFILFIVCVSISSFVFGQIDPLDPFNPFGECPCNTTAIDCTCPVYVTPTPTPLPDPVILCGGIDVSDYFLNNDFNSEDYEMGINDGRIRTAEFMRLSLAGCESDFLTSYSSLVSGLSPNPNAVVNPSLPQLSSQVEVPVNSQIMPVSGGYDAGCADALRGYLELLSEIIGEKIQQELDSPGSTGYSLEYWLGFCTGFEMSASSW